VGLFMKGHKVAQTSGDPPPRFHRHLKRAGLDYRNREQLFRRGYHMGVTAQKERPTTTIRAVGSAIVMLVGIVALAFGYFQDSRLLLYAGITITLAGVLTGLIFSVLLRQPKDSNSGVM
jgi:uncharacterized membrane protein YdfJ with MMPL/SSD domain